MKSEQEIAAIILERRSRATHVIMPGDLAEQLGGEAVALAVKNRWVVPDYDDGWLKVNSDANIVRQMEEIAATAPKPVKESVQSPNESRGFAMGHSKRTLQEFAAPGSGQDDKPAAPAVQQPMQSTNQPAPVTPASAAQPGEHKVGDTVMVANEGKSYQAVVQAKNGDGTYSLSFGPQRPATQRFYRKEELQGVLQSASDRNASGTAPRPATGRAGTAPRSRQRRL